VLRRDEQEESVCLRVTRTIVNNNFSFPCFISWFNEAGEEPEALTQPAALTLSCESKWLDQ
jgi:hypothetical protein